MCVSPKMTNYILFMHKYFEHLDREIVAGFLLVVVNSKIVDFDMWFVIEQ
jgi:hypothetical protein